MNRLGIFVNFWQKTWDVNYRRYIDKMAKLGGDILEFQAQPLLDIEDSELRAIRKYADEAGIEMTYSLGLNKQYDIASRDAQVRKAGIKYLSDICRKIGVMGGGLFSGVTYCGWGVPEYFVETAEKEALYEHSTESMKQVLKVAENEGVMICVEAVNRFESPLLNTAKEALRYLKMVGSDRLGILLDTYHMNIEEDSIGDAIRLAGDKLKHFHTGENNRNIPGRGHLNWDEIFQALKEIGYKGRIVSEPFLMMGNEVGYDIRVWRTLLENPSEDRLDAAAKELLDFTRSKLRAFTAE